MIKLKESRNSGLNNKFLGAIAGDFSKSLAIVSQHLFQIRHQQVFSAIFGDGRKKFVD